MNKTPDLTFNILELEHEQYGRGSKRFNQDEARLARFGKRQQLQARLSAKMCVS